MAIYHARRLASVKHDLTRKDEELNQLRRAGLVISSRLRLEEHHRVRITDGALAEAVRLAASSSGELALPASAVDLLDGACAWAVSRPELATEVGEEEVRRAHAA